MKGILTTIIHSVFKFVINPTIWSRVVADLSPREAEESRPSISQLRQIQDADLRDANLSKALDIVDVQLKLLITQKSTQTISVSQPSAVEILPISETTEHNSRTSSEQHVHDEHETLGSSEGVIDELNENNVNSLVVDRSIAAENQSSTVIAVDRSRSDYIPFPSLNGSSPEPSEISAGSDSSKLDSDIEFVPDLPTQFE